MYFFFVSNYFEFLYDPYIYAPFTSNYCFLKLLLSQTKKSGFLEFEIMLVEFSQTKYMTILFLIPNC